jgi:ABC-2 type transport system permease protein
MLIVVGVCLAVFLLVTQGLGRRFARDASLAVGSDASRRKAGKTGAFAAGAFAATLRKEMRLLFRDIALFSQVLLRVFYMLPLAFIFVRNASSGSSLLLPGGAAALALMAGQLASSFTWITVSAEDSPELLVASPTAMSVITRAKLWAGLIPTIALVALPILAVGFWSPWIAFVAAVGAIASGWASGMLNIWYQKPSRRADFRRRGNVHWLLVIPILLIGGLIAGATFLAAAGMPWAVVPAVLAAVGMLALRRSDEQILERLRSLD